MRPSKTLGRVVDQPLVARHSDGMVPCSVVQDRVAGFGHQRVPAHMEPVKRP